MNIHIVCSRLNADRVLPRLARMLADKTGWTIGESPIRTAALNYFFPYLELQKREWKDTKSAAWFTHHDTENKSKSLLWDNIAHRVDLRTLTARIYQSNLASAGEVSLVRPAIELDRFKPVKRWHSATNPRVGVSGFSYNDNRKGEDLIAQLVQSEPGKQAEWSASGRGWAVPTKTYAWDKMPDFYQSLDLYICASRIEGVPMPPLEALACGVPVIVPIGVGMLDDLPNVRGIYRFKSGDYADLLRAFKEAVGDKPANPAQLRAAVEQYNAENWATDHQIAFEKLLYGTQPMAKKQVATNSKNGIYCVAFGEPSRNCAVRLIASVKKFAPDVPIMLVSSEPLNAGETLFVKQDDKDIGGRWAKLAIDRLAPAEWDNVLYLDADTELVEPIGFLFKLLDDGWEFVICKDMTDRHFLAQMNRGDNAAECKFTNEFIGTDRVMCYNGGVFAYRRCEATRKFFEGWNVEYDKWCGRDQGALLRSFYANQMRTFVLMNQWNASDRYPLPPGKIAIMHHNVQARRYKKGVKGRLDGKQAWEMVQAFEAAQ